MLHNKVERSVEHRINNETIVCTLMVFGAKND